RFDFFGDRDSQRFRLLDISRLAGQDLAIKRIRGDHVICRKVRGSGKRGLQHCERERRNRERLQDFHREVSLVLVASTPCRYPFIGGSASWSLWPRVRVLLLCAKHLFIEPNRIRDRVYWAGGRSAKFGRAETRGASAVDFSRNPGPVSRRGEKHA